MTRSRHIDFTNPSTAARWAGVRDDQRATISARSGGIWVGFGDEKTPERTPESAEGSKSPVFTELFSTTGKGFAIRSLGPLGHPAGKFLSPDVSGDRPHDQERLSLLARRTSQEAHDDEQAINNHRGQPPRTPMPITAAHNYRAIAISV